VLVEEMHVDDDVAGIELAVRLALLSAPHFGNALLRNEHFENEVTHLLGFATALDIVPHLQLLSGENVNDIPLALGCGNCRHSFLSWKFRLAGGSETGRQKSHDRMHRKIDRRDKSTEETHRDEDHNGRVGELLVFF